MFRASRALLGLFFIAIGSWSLSVCPAQAQRQSPYVEGVDPARDAARDIALDLIRLGSDPQEVRWVEPSAHGAIAHISATLALAILATGAALVIDSLLSRKPK